MIPWDIIGLFVLAVVITVPAALFMLYIVGGYIIARHREECPSCHRRRLRVVQAWRWQIRIKRETKPARAIYLCEACGAHYLERDPGAFEVASAQEWEMYSSPDYPRSLLRKLRGGGPPDAAPPEPGTRS